MKKKTKKNSILILIIGVVFLLQPIVSSASENPENKNLLVVFEKEPLFSESNFLPSETISRHISVTNLTAGTKKIAIRANNVTDHNNFGSQLRLDIKDGETLIYQATLSDFFQNSGIELSSLDTNQSKNYSLSINFLANSKNIFQGATLNFDIDIGWQETSSGGSGSFSESISPEHKDLFTWTGPGYTYDKLVIFNEVVESYGHLTKTAVITWYTSKPATSRVIYDTISHPDISQTSPPNYGYAFSTNENSNKVTFHKVVVYGLQTETKYFFRSVSHASPEEVGQEFSFFTTVTSTDKLSTKKTPLTNSSGFNAKIKNIIKEPVDYLNQLGQKIAGTTTYNQGNTNSKEKSEDNRFVWRWWLIIILIIMLVVIVIRLARLKREK